MRSIYVQLSVFLAIGIYLGDRVSAGDALIFIFALFLTAGLRKPVIKKFFPAHTFVILMTAFGILLYHNSISQNIRTAYPLQDKYVTMLGKITDLPCSEFGNNIYLVDVKLMNYLDKNYEVKERIRVTSPETFKFGDSVRIEGFLKPFSKKLNSRDYDSARGYKAKGIYFRMFADSMTLTNTKFRSYSPVYFFTWIKSKISDRIYEYYSGDEAAVMRAVLTGYKDAFSAEFEQELYDSNMMRMFYPAFMHISFIFMLVGMLGAYLKKEKRDKVLILLLVLYALANTNYHYIVKTAAVTAVLIYSKQKIGFSNYMDVLSFIIGTVLITNPLIGYETGFIISVAANILIYYFMQPVLQRIKFVKDPKIKNFFALGIILSVGLLPLQAYFFNATTPYAFLLNFLYMPLISVLLIFTPLSWFFSAMPGGVNIFKYVPDGIVFFMKVIPGLVQKLPFYLIHLPRPGILAIAVFYMLLYIFRQRILKKKQWNFSMQAVCAVIVGFSIIGVSDFAQKVNDLEISFVNVGQGDGAVLSVPFRETVIIDGGGSSEYSDYDYGEKVFLPYIKREGHNKIDLAIVSHYHSDHCKGVIAAMKRLKVKEVLMPDCMEDNKYRKEIEQIAAKKKIKLSYFKSGTKLKFNSGLVFEIIAPNNIDLKSDEENDTSFGIRVVYGDFSALFTGDLTEEVEKRHMGEWRKCNILKVPHHGSLSSSSEEFIKEVSPEAAVISVGEGNTYGLPKEEVIERYLKNNINLYRTDLYGNITVSADKDGSFVMSSFLEN